MTIFKINRDNFENTTIQATPGRTFSSSSLGVTGSINVFPRRSHIEKELGSPPSVMGIPMAFDDNFVGLMWGAASHLLAADIANPAINTDYSGVMELVLEVINDIPPSQIIHNSSGTINRLTRSVNENASFEKKRYITDNLYPANRVEFPSSHFSYTNYHSLNFFTASQVPTQACLLYPNSASIAHETKASGSYVVDDGFTFEFHINPKNYFEANDSGYSAGTILHLSSSYAISLVSGSSKDERGNADKFRIQLQLSHSADVTPAEAIQGSYPNDLIFLSDDNVLDVNSWNHVAIRWKNKRNANSGSFVVNNIEKGSFVLPSSSIAPAAYAGGSNPGNPDVLVVGNYYVGDNAGVNKQAKFFSSQVASYFGLVNLDPAETEVVPESYDFVSPLNAEMHDLKIFTGYRDDDQVYTGSIQGASSRKEKDLALHVPPFFSKESPYRKVRKSLNAAFGFLGKPMYQRTENPFNAWVSFNVGGHILNLENFTRDLSTLNFPRHMSLTGAIDTEIPLPSTTATANDGIFDVPELRYRNLFLLPCDDGNFKPNFALVETGSIPSTPVKSGSLFYHYTNDLDYVDMSMIKLRELIPSQSFPQVGNQGYETIRAQSRILDQSDQYANPENPTRPAYVLPAVYGRTLDNSSDEVIIFDITKLYYGEKIRPGTLQMTDTSLTGSGGQISMTLKDDGYGNLYRSSASTTNATWNSVGNVFYDEGIVVVKSPNIPLFGKDQFEMSFKGQHEVHVLKLHVIAPAATLNSSSNPSYIPVSASLNANETNPEFVAITGINFHDDNLNVIMKTKFAQPVIKRTDDRVMFRSKLDF